MKRGRLSRALQCGPYFAQKLILHNAVAEFDRGREAFGIRPAMALDDNAVEPEEHPAIDAARIHPFAQMPESRTREQVADARAQGACHRIAQILAELPRGAFGGFKRDIAGKPFGHDNIDFALADIVAFDEALIIEIGQRLLAQDAAGLAHLFQAFGLLGTDIEVTDGRRPATSLAASRAT